MNADVLTPRMLTVQFSSGGDRERMERQLFPSCHPLFLFILSTYIHIHVKLPCVFEAVCHNIFTTEIAMILVFHDRTVIFMVFDNTSSRLFAETWSSVYFNPIKVQ